MVVLPQTVERRFRLSRVDVLHGVDIQEKVELACGLIAPQKGRAHSNDVAFKLHPGEFFTIVRNLEIVAGRWILP